MRWWIDRCSAKRSNEPRETYTPHVPKFVWAQEEATIVEEENDDGVCCQLCGHRPGDISECGTCHLNMCASYMPLHSCILQG